jgi:nitroimidazol reductase NimA-like FMN-containing flavoprotein (pyridoxamine 5'-phosphate oxidase superfamily)
MIAAWLDRFFRQRRVAVLAIPRPGRSPLATPVWFDWDGARFRVQVEAGSAKARALAGGAPVPVALTVQSEVPPYRYAVVHGVATLRPNDEAGLRRRLARRYFGRWAGDLYVAGEEQRGVDDAALQVIEIVPERTVAHDFRPEAGLSGRIYFAISRWLRPVPA